MPGPHSCCGDSIQSNLPHFHKDQCPKRDQGAGCGLTAPNPLLQQQNLYRTIMATFSEGGCDTGNSYTNRAHKAPCIVITEEVLWEAGQPSKTIAVSLQQNRELRGSVIWLHFKLEQQKERDIKLSSLYQSQQ